MKHILLLFTLLLVSHYTAYSQNNDHQEKNKAEERREARNLIRNKKRNNAGLNGNSNINSNSNTNNTTPVNTTIIDDTKTEEQKEEILDDIHQLEKPSDAVNETKDNLEEEAEESAKSIISYEKIIALPQKEDANAGELPVEGQKVKLMIQNNHSTPMWYIMPVSGEKTLPTDGKFNVNPDADLPFIAKKYEQGTGQLVELIYHGLDGQSFRAFYVEAGSSLLFRNYDLGSYAQGDIVPFWSAKELHLNDEILLENWLPFSVKSSPNVVLHNNTESGPAQWVNLCKEAKFPKTKVQFIWANHIKRYQIPVGITN